MFIYLILTLSCSEYSINKGEDLNFSENGGYGTIEHDILGYPPENACDTYFEEDTDSTIPSELAVVEGCVREVRRCAPDSTAVRM